MTESSTNSFIGGALAGVVLTCAWFFVGPSLLMPLASPASVATGTEVLQQQNSSVSVSNQASGDSVVIESVTVPPPGVWIAVREVIAGDLGNVLGAARVSGPRTTITIPLLRATEPDHSYAVQLYRDDDNGSFDAAVNSTYVDFATGARAIVYFTTTE